MLLLLQHVPIMSTCSYVISTFLTFAVLVVCCRPCFGPIFHCACAKTPICERPVKNLSPPFAPATSISYKTDAFPLPSDVYWIYSMFLGYYVDGLVTLTFDLLTFRVLRVVLLMSDTHKPSFIILRLLVTELRVLNI